MQAENCRARKFNHTHVIWSPENPQQAIELSVAPCHNTGLLTFNK
jgi:hypothetical protein